MYRFGRKRTRSQAVARIADHTASSTLIASHVTSSVTWLFDSHAISYW